MKMKIGILAFSAIVFLAACSPKTAKTTSSSSPAPAASSTEPSEAMVTAGKTKFPDVTLDVLKKGQTIYNGPCTRCHGAKSIVKRDEKEWVEVLNDMAPKANLSVEDKDAVWKYIMSVKLASK